MLGQVVRNRRQDEQIAEKRLMRQRDDLKVVFECYAPKSGNVGVDLVSSFASVTLDVVGGVEMTTKHQVTNHHKKN